MKKGHQEAEKQGNIPGTKDSDQAGCQVTHILSEEHEQ